MSSRRILKCDRTYLLEGNQSAALIDLSARPGSNMVGEGHEGTAVSVHYAAVQQVTGCWLFYVRLQTSRSPR